MTAAWRDLVPATATDDVDSLFDDVLAVAHGKLSSLGLFTPFLVAIEEDGNRVTRMAETSGDDRQVRESLLVRDDPARDDRSALRAFAIAVDGAAHHGRDAFQVHLEHRDGVAVTLLVPYEFGSADEPQFVVAHLVATSTEAVLWGARG
ncbi:MAG TPA: hypothetical protein PK331_08450 [Gordonia sp. (in: high G+C Gram-positive bacteria)]|uniref:hypothetical protein n=1 Tax=unclassified Gordonia (in: high G+C Gram-positive bacteria) TaxID=2657482 RepID=UPI0025BC3C11|nr:MULTISPECIES: hypothetical protein [unclassified Gordonia (in: high G+C Gram-positive bacteria)]HNP55843.1 hypothetical protein [Gordonia sp. (in: high G+C Gram-positive bacteria)]HRC50934.1 hypothetical protein [Gordonia sp. (in: high G+C Gram-positive bacteria)]